MSIIRDIMGRLKNWLLNKFFKAEFDSVIADLNTQLNIREKKIQCGANRIIEEKTTALDMMRLALRDRFDVIGENDNKIGEHVIVAKKIGKSSAFGTSLDFFLYGKRYQAINRHPRIMATYKEPNNGEPFVNIEDILVEDNDLGNGSILMPYFIDYCMQTKAAYICGNLSSRDKRHFDRSIHFYEKHGFVVSLGETGESGSIRCELR